MAVFQLELTFYTWRSVCIFSLPCAIHFLWNRQGEFVQQGRAFFVSDYFFFSYDLNVWFSGNTVWRIWTLLLPELKRLLELSWVRSSLLTMLFADAFVSQTNNRTKLTSVHRYYFKNITSRNNITRSTWLRTFSPWLCLDENSADRK